MTRRFLVLIALVLAAAGTSPAAAQSLYGPGGLFLHPTADVPKEGQLTPAFLILPQHNPVADSTRTWETFSLDYGLSDKLEIGLTGITVAGWNKDPSVGGFFKYQFMGETSSRPAAAFGATGLFGGELNTRSAFLAFRKQVGNISKHPIVAHLGVSYVDVEDGLPRDSWRPYAGIEFGISSRLSFIAEARPRGDREFGTPLALTLAYRVNDNWRLALSWANSGQSDRPMFGFGAGFSLGARR
jgi:hypothetical protein